MIASPLLLTMSTSYCHSLHLPLSLCCYCIIELYWFVFLNCIIALCICIYPQSTVSTGLYLFSTPTCLLLIVFLLQEERFICIDILYYYLHIATDLDISCWYLSASTIVEGCRLCPHPYKYLLSWGKFGVLPPIIDWLSDDSDVASVAV